jgi:hypothetical protein
MLLWHQPGTTTAGFTYFHDDAKPNLFYVLPKQPRFRIGEDGNPVFELLKYKKPIERANGVVGGGYVIFDVEFSLTPAEQAAIVTELQARLDTDFGGSDKAPKVEIGDIPYLRGTAGIQILDSGGTMVTKVHGPAAPALYGNMVTPFTAELSQEGATLLESALQDKGGVVQVFYDIFTPVKLPPMTAEVWFNADKMMEFHQNVQIDWSLWGEDEYRESVQEQFRSSEVHQIKIDPGAVTDQKVIQAVTDWARSTLETATKRLVLGDIPSITEDQRKVPDGIDNLWRDFRVDKSASFYEKYEENHVMEWNPAPRGTLPNITTLNGPDGKPLLWSQFAREVDLDDPFFRTLKVSVRANAPFSALPIDSVEVKLAYEGDRTYTHEYSLMKPDDLGKFEAFVRDNNYKYHYSYQVNYKGESRNFQSSVIETDEEVLTINVGDTGVLDVEVSPGDIDFSQVTRAQVVLTYDDPANSVAPIERSVIIDKDHLTARIQEVVFSPVAQPYKYSVKYTMANGKELASSRPIESRSQKLFVNDPFSATRTISVRAFGDLNARIDTIFLDLVYEDAANSYTQTKSVALNKANPFVDWSIPVIDDKAGGVTYSGTIRFQNGSIETLAVAKAEGNTIMVGDVPRTISVLPDLIDFAKAKLVKVALHYADPANGIDETGDLVFRAGAKETSWSHAFRKGGAGTYHYDISYFVGGAPAPKKVDGDTSELVLVVPEVPA